MVLAVAGLVAQEAKIELGDINGAPFRIDVPANWNGSLVLYCHGYGGPNNYDKTPLNARIKVFTDMGYAMAQSAYSAHGWAVKEAMEDTCSAACRSSRADCLGWPPFKGICADIPCRIARAYCCAMTEILSSLIVSRVMEAAHPSGLRLQ